MKKTKKREGWIVRQYKGVKCTCPKEVKEEWGKGGHLFSCPVFVKGEK